MQVRECRSHKKQRRWSQTGDAETVDVESSHSLPDELPVEEDATLSPDDIDHPLLHSGAAALQEMEDINCAHEETMADRSLLDTRGRPDELQRGALQEAMGALAELPISFKFGDCRHGFSRGRRAWPSAHSCHLVCRSPWHSLQGLPVPTSAFGFCTTSGRTNAAHLTASLTHGLTLDE